MPGIKADYVELSPAQFMSQPGCHGARLDPDRRPISSMPPDGLLDLLWMRRALAPPEPATSVIDDAD
jgi:hypothetical protein